MCECWKADDVPIAGRRGTRRPRKGATVSPERDTAATDRAAGRRAPWRLRARIVPTGRRHAVTASELFFDLVFVFAITQVTAFMTHDLGWRGILRGLVLLA